VGTATKLSNIAKGKIAQGSNEAVNGSQLSNLGYHLGLEVNNDGTGFKAPQLSALEGSTTTPTNVVDALNAATDKLNEGITLAGNNHIAGIKATEINKNLGEAFTIVGGYTGTEASANNLRTVVKNGVLEIQMAEKPVFSEVTATDKVTVGAGNETAEITKDGTRIKGVDGKTANYTLDGSTIDDGQGNSVETTALYNRFIDKDGNLSNHNARGTGYLDSDGNVGGYNAKGVELVDIDGNEAAYTAKGIDYAKEGEKGTGTITGLKDLDDQSHGTTAVNKNYVDGKFTNIVGDVTQGDVKLDKDGNILTKDEVAKDPSKVAKTIENVLVDSDGKPVFVTHNVDGRGEYIQNDIASAVRNMNEQGIKYFHTNDGQNRDPRLDDVFNKEDAKASGKYSTAVGYQAHAEGENAVAMGNNAVASAYSLAIGPNAKATGKRSVSVGIGNIVEADSSGAFGEPNYIDGKVVNGQTTVSGSYAVGNNNVINSSNTFVFGSNVNNSGQVDSAGKPVAMGDTVENSVYLGDRTTATKGNGVGTRNRTVTGEVGQTTTAGDKGTVATATVGGVTYGGFAGAVANGVVSVGAAGAERRIQNVAAGEISPTSTDAINGSQLYSVANTLSQGMNNMANNVNMNFNRLNNRISDVDRKLRSGIAGAVAMSTLVQAYNSSDSLVSIGTGTYRGSSALAVGYSRVSDNGKIIIKLSGSVNNAGHYMGGASVGYRF
ncbi:YadA family autotransporter adhesin, partial [Actinobacillus porcinus]|uniref:YadA family autotransporter adhesin n=1 Tax=Actinobacillus porcinus TaxID=51048 RepID=UPI0023567E2A